MENQDPFYHQLDKLCSTSDTGHDQLMETHLIQVDCRLYMRDGPPQLGITVVAPSTQQTRQNPNNISNQNGTHTQEGLQITKIQQGSVVDRVGQFKVGDIIIEVNGVNLQRPFAEAQKALKQFVIDNFSHGPLELKVLRKSNRTTSVPEVVQQTDETTRIVTSKSSPNLVGALNTRKIGVKYTIKLKKSINGFGMKIAARDNMHRARNRPIYITAITTSGSAYQDGRLREGDMLLKVNGIDVQAKTQPEVTTLLKNIKANEEAEFVISRQEDLPNEVDEPEVHTYDIPLNDTRSAGLGLYLRYSCRADDPKNLSIWIEKVITGGAAWKDGRLRPDDQILAINDKELVGSSNVEASETLTAAVCRGDGPEATIRLRIQRKPAQSIANLSSETQTTNSSSNEISVSPHTQASNSLKVTKEQSSSEKTNETASSILSSQMGQISSSESLDNAAIYEDGYIIHFQRDGFGRQSMSEKRHAQLNAKNTDTFKRNQKMREEKDQQRQLEEQFAKQHLGDEDEGEDKDKYKKKKKRSPVTWLRSQNPFKSVLSGSSSAPKHRTVSDADTSGQHVSQGRELLDQDPSNWGRTPDQPTNSIKFNKTNPQAPAVIQGPAPVPLMGAHELDAYSGQTKAAPFHPMMSSRHLLAQQPAVSRPFVESMLQPGLMSPQGISPAASSGMMTSESHESYANSMTGGRQMTAMVKAPSSQTGVNATDAGSSGQSGGFVGIRGSTSFSSGQGMTIGGRAGQNTGHLGGYADNAALLSGYSETKGNRDYETSGGGAYVNSSYGNRYVNKQPTMSPEPFPKKNATGVANETNSSHNGTSANGTGAGSNNINSLDMNSLSLQYPAKGYDHNNYYGHAGQQGHLNQQHLHQYEGHQHPHHHHQYHHQQQQHHHHNQYQNNHLHQSFHNHSRTLDADQLPLLGSTYGQHANNYHPNQQLAHHHNLHHHHQQASGQWQGPALAAGRAQYISARQPHQANQQVPFNEPQYFNHQQQGRFPAGQQQIIVENGHQQPPHQHSQSGYQAFSANGCYQLRPQVQLMPQRQPPLARFGPADKHALMVRTNPGLWSLL